MPLIYKNILSYARKSINYIYDIPINCKWVINLPQANDIIKNYYCPLNITNLFQLVEI